MPVPVAKEGSGEPPLRGMRRVRAAASEEAAGVLQRQERKKRSEDARAGLKVSRLKRCDWSSRRALVLQAKLCRRGVERETSPSQVASVHIPDYTNAIAVLPYEPASQP